MPELTDSSKREGMVKSTTLTVTPIPASESRTLRLSWRVTLWTSIAALAPSIIGMLFDMLGDPVIGAYVSDAIPAKYRLVFGAAFVILAQRYKQLRNDTGAPIIGTPAAAPATPVLVTTAPVGEIGEEKVGS